jgi:hydroxymethylpyrimidine/phosphomethylpyrimidine kinase
MMPIALTVAGSDPSGGAGLQADLKTFHQHGVYGTSVVTLLTVQNTKGVQRLEVVPPSVVEAQLACLLDDLVPAAAKTGALGTAPVVEVVARAAVRFAFPLVVDPVMISKHGHPLLDRAAQEVMRYALLPRAFLVTPNVPEAEAMSGLEVKTLEQAKEAAKAIAKLGPKNVLVKGGHLDGAPVDVLLHGGEIIEFPGTRVDTPHTHGTGCTLSAAITAWLAKGLDLPEAVGRAKAWLTIALRTAPGLGAGAGPVNHFAKV